MHEMHEFTQGDRVIVVGTGIGGEQLSKRTEGKILATQRTDGEFELTVAFCGQDKAIRITKEQAKNIRKLSYPGTPDIASMTFPWERTNFSADENDLGRHHESLLAEDQ